MTDASIAGEIQAFWDDDAAGYDNTDSHHPRRLPEIAAWSGALRRLLPAPPARVLDAGAGTGFLSLLLAGQGYDVTALDLSARMLDAAAAKAARHGLDIRTVHGDAARPPAGTFDIVVERHLIWTLPDPAAALAAWHEVAPAGRLALIEGSWGAAAGLDGLRAGARAAAQRIRGAAPGHHGHYSSRVLNALPLGNGISPADAIALVQASPWGAARLERLRDIEWAVLDGRGLLDQLLGTPPRWAITAGS
jgi:SAM-dependent methyltransferase